MSEIVEETIALHAQRTRDDSIHRYGRDSIGVGQTIKEIPYSQLLSVWVTGICTQNSDNISVAEEGYLIDLCI